jgi:hypothetical protein
MVDSNPRREDPRRGRLNARLRRLKASTMALTVAAAISLWWLVGGAVAVTQAGPQASPTQDTGNQFFTNQQPTLGNGSASTPILRSAGS